ncbi:MAG TPA: hypothetical protein DEQ39_09300 [Atlantibacter hermannii]|nr:hypothetical protein [Enterobacteriaceae bacterium]HAP81076.1 hypothetical protein [Enterobacteriaceae bacterium]HCC11053.1 hypothetical protein [Atlantibacter hermannii]
MSKPNGCGLISACLTTEDNFHPQRREAIPRISWKIMDNLFRTLLLSPFDVSLSCHQFGEQHWRNAL